MDENVSVLEYKCPCCNGVLVFSSQTQNLTCPYCDNEFDLEAVQVYNESLTSSDEEGFQWDQVETSQWNEEEQSQLRTFVCPACGGELVTDENTVATFCPYCENPSILPGRVGEGLKPDGVIPFRKSKEDAKAAFLNLCKGKPLLPKMFTEQQRVEKITGIYVPFWLYDCQSQFHGSYKATRVHHRSDSRYNYTITEHYHLARSASAEFAAIPMDGSHKMDNTIMESIEPFDFSKVVNFETAYLSGYLADKYDVESKEGESRIKQRVSASMDSMIQSSLLGYTTVMPASRKLQVQHGKARYVLLPVWMLHTKYQDQTYVFAMNGQTGKMTGTFPICPKRSAMWFGGICAAVTALASVIQMLF